MPTADDFVQHLRSPRTYAQVVRNGSPDRSKIIDAPKLVSEGMAEFVRQKTLYKMHYDLWQIYEHKWRIFQKSDHLKC